MSPVVGHSPPPFFKRGPAPLVRLSFFVALSLVLVVADLRFGTLEWARQAIATAIWPLQRAGQAPAEAIQRTGEYFSSLVSLKAENDELRERHLAVANQLLRQQYLENENLRLRALLGMKESQPAKGQVAEILFAVRDPFSRRVVIDRGSGDGLERGQVVIDDVGVIGQVTRVYPMMSEVTLLTDKDQAIPIQVQRNGLRAVLFGAGAGALELRYLAANADIEVGDTLVTSGLDGLYLPGLPVARVKRIDRDNSYAFARIECEPLAGVERYGHVLVLDRRASVDLPKELIDPPIERPKGGRKKTRRNS